MQVDNTPRMPYIQFVTKAVEDRDATEKTGGYVSKDQIFVHVTPQGSKDKIERVAVEWLEQMAFEEKQGRLPEGWYRKYKEFFEDYKQGRETPPDGFSIRDWPAASPAQVESCIRAHIRTVEDLAAANEESLMRIGMGAQALKQKAVAWLAARKDVGQVAERLASLEAENKTLKSSNETLQGQVRDLLNRVDVLIKAASGAKSTPQAEAVGGNAGDLLDD